MINNTVEGNVRGISELKNLWGLKIIGTDLQKSVDDGDFDLFSVTNLYLENTSLTAVPTRSMSGRVAGVLSLNGNKITSINENDFTEKLANVARLYLDDNPISSIEQGALKKLTSLRELSMQRNSLKTFDFSWFGNDYNYFSSIDLQESKSLKTIECSNPKVVSVQRMI
jgi:Leucine-rich repeat (LRR) protein